MIPCNSNQTSTTFITKTDRLNCFVQYLVPIFFDVKNFLAATIVPINLVTCAVVDFWCDWLWGGQINHIRLCIWDRVLFLHCMQMYNHPFSIDPTVKIKYRLFRSIQKICNTDFVMYTGLVNNPLISPWFWNSILDRYAIGDFHVSVLITPIKQSPHFHNVTTAVTDAKYESAQMILYVLSHGRTSSFSNFLPWGILSLPSSFSISLL